MKRSTIYNILVVVLSILAIINLGLLIRTMLCENFQWYSPIGTAYAFFHLLFMAVGTYIENDHRR